jgi:hypothetical protein
VARAGSGVAFPPLDRTSLCVTTIWLIELGETLCLPERAGLDLHAHHGEDAAHVVRWDGPVLVGEAVEAPLQHQNLEKGKKLDANFLSQASNTVVSIL